MGKKYTFRSKMRKHWNRNLACGASKRATNPVFFFPNQLETSLHSMFTFSCSLSLPKIFLDVKCQMNSKENSLFKDYHKSKELMVPSIPLVILKFYITWTVFKA